MGLQDEDDRKLPDPEDEPQKIDWWLQLMTRQPSQIDRAFRHEANGRHH